MITVGMLTAHPRHSSISHTSCWPPCPLMHMLTHSHSHSHMRLKAGQDVSTHVARRPPRNTPSSMPIPMQLASHHWRHTHDHHVRMHDEPAASEAQLLDGFDQTRL